MGRKFTLFSSSSFLLDFPHQGSSVGWRQGDAKRLDGHCHFPSASCTRYTCPLPHNKMLLLCLFCGNNFHCVGSWSVFPSDINGMWEERAGSNLISDATQVGAFNPDFFPPDLSNGVYWIMHSNAAISPILHILFDRQLRTGIKQLLCVKGAVEHQNEIVL